MGATILTDFPMALYVADRLPGEPITLSSSIAHRLLTRSPLHAWTAHPRLNPAWAPDDNRDFDLGTAAHAVLLEGRAVTVVPFDSYRSNAAKAARDEIIAAGGIPAKTDEAAAVEGMVDNARAKLAACSDISPYLGSEHIETTAVWRQDDVWLRCRPDLMTAGFEVIVSLKTTGGSADPDAFLRTILGLGYDIQAAFELAAVKAARAADARYVWLACETLPPYACSLVGMTGEVRAFAEMRFRAAVRKWTACLQENRWPAYSDEIERPELPAWAQSQHIDRHGYTPEPVADDDRPIEEAMFERGILP